MKIKFIFSLGIDQDPPLLTPLIYQVGHMSLRYYRVFRFLLYLPVFFKTKFNINIQRLQVDDPLN